MAWGKDETVGKIIYRKKQNTYKNAYELKE